MPTREVLASFWRDWDQLSPKQQREFRDAVAQFIANLAEASRAFIPGFASSGCKAIPVYGR